MRKCSNGALRTLDNDQTFAKNLSNVPYNRANKCKSVCSCQYRFYSDENHDPSRPSRSKDFPSVDTWNSPDSLVQKLSGSLKITNENIPANEANRRLANSFQYANYYQNFAINAAEQNGEIAYAPFSNQNFVYNLQNIQEPPQQFLWNDVKPAAVNHNVNWCSPNEAYRCESRNIGEVSNVLSNDVKYTNNYQSTDHSQQQNYGSLVGPSTFNERFAYENSANFAENLPQFGENFQSFLLSRD
ncbi:hypothetical protein WH47_04296 [Habropoda laboriosa]|uniref:Uncharacterized protein n=1 Tax=Habropoda laboriosa TaxID=597456 RepID=A0A0L7QRA7_9HYME|nr:hypothetical protein WH47_04296 [Habropoda laboriosa]